MTTTNIELTTETQNRLARLGRYILARIERTRAAGVPTRGLDELYNEVQRAKEGNLKALDFAARLWNNIAGHPDGRHELDLA